MRARFVVVILVFAALAAGFGGLVISLYDSNQLSQNTAALRTLLLDGKTASAIAAKKTATEVKSLIALQAFDHRQTVNAEKQAATGQATLKAVIREVETHLDATIQRSVTQAAEKVAKEFKQ